MNRPKLLLLLCALCAPILLHASSPVTGLLERIDKGASRKFIIEQTPSDTDFFELDQRGRKVVVRGNNYVSIATGINWYLKYHAGIHLSWNGMTARLPDVLPPVTKRERHQTPHPYRYYLNYCTYSYTMAFWDWERWEREIDWMALHGINLPLALTGAETVWFNVLERLGYERQEIDAFISGPAFMAWWLMNNLEGWGGPNPDSWYARRVELQQKILARMREYGIKPVLPGYCGMVPANAKQKLGLHVSDPGLWCGHSRPAFLQPEDSRFEQIAGLYYEELEKLFGKAEFYSIDPFHEGGNTEGVDLGATGKAVMKAMKSANPDAVWIIQAWQDNPRPQMIDSLAQGDILVLDLYSESRPQWGDPVSEWYRKEGYGKHDWVYCMLLNFGGNVGLFGKMDAVIDGYYKAQEHPRASKTFRGTGLTMEGIQNNTVMYELVSELAWRPERFTKEQWLDTYTTARYGVSDPAIREAWAMLGRSVYNCPKTQTQEGTHESIFCARPDLNAYQVSTWSAMKDYYDPQEVIAAARQMLSSADKFAGNNNFEYDLTDIVRQAVAEQGRLTLKIVAAAYNARDKELFRHSADKFLRQIALQDKLLGTRAEFRLGSWIEQAKSLGGTPEEKAHLEWNARVQITTWGNRHSADQAGLRDYAHKEWSGLLRDFYARRWRLYFDALQRTLEGETPDKIDFYAIEEAWTRQTNPYSPAPEGDCIATAREVMEELLGR